LSADSSLNEIISFFANTKLSKSLLAGIPTYLFFFILVKFKNANIHIFFKKMGSKSIRLIKHLDSHFILPTCFASISVLIFDAINAYDRHKIE
jgi:hypothetical protein